jgi:hypothetical protein
MSDSAEDQEMKELCRKIHSMLEPTMETPRTVAIPEELIQSFLDMIDGKRGGAEGNKQLFPDLFPLQPRDVQLTFREAIEFYSLYNGLIHARDNEYAYPVTEGQAYTFVFAASSPGRAFYAYRWVQDADDYL